METTRRRFLGGLAVASALASATVAQAPMVEGENPDLLALGEQFDAVYARFLEADKELPAFQDAYRAIAPSGDGVVFTRAPAYLRLLTEMVPDPTSPQYSKWKSPEGEFYLVIRADAIERAIKGRRIRDTPEAWQIVDRARAFEVAVEVACKSSGLSDALEAWWQAEFTLRRLIAELCDNRARTPQGVAMKIKATAAYATLGHEERFTAAQWLSKAVWEDMGEDA